MLRMYLVLEECVDHLHDNEGERFVKVVQRRDKLGAVPRLLRQRLGLYACPVLRPDTQTEKSCVQAYSQTRCERYS